MTVNKKSFNKYADHPLQAWEWGEFRKSWGNKIVRFQIKTGKITDSVQLVISGLPNTKYGIGTVLKGPLPSKNLIKKLKNLGRDENLIFIKLEPNYVIKKNGIDCADKEKYIKILRREGAVSGKTLFTPTTFWIDLTKSEDKLLKGFSSKTRYNIRLSQRKGVVVKEDNSNKVFEKYLQLTRETVERQGFYAHTEKYHRLMWKYLNKEMKKRGNKEPSGPDLRFKKPKSSTKTRPGRWPIARLLVAKYEGEIITAWIVFVWKDFLYYPYGASSSNPKFKNLMANNLMMWEAIKFGKKLGLKTFDLWGREPGKGFTRFKEGYNPQVVEFLGSWDLPTSPFYRPYRAAEEIRWKLLRLRNKFSKPTF